MKNSNDTFGNRNRGLPASSAVPQPTAYHIQTRLLFACLSQRKPRFFCFCGIMGRECGIGAGFSESAYGFTCKNHFIHSSIIRCTRTVPKELQFKKTASQRNDEVIVFAIQIRNFTLFGKDEQAFIPEMCKCNIRHY